MSDAINIDYDRHTGENVVGWAAVEVSLREIFLTDYGSRVMREWFGSFVPRVLGRNVTAEVLLPLQLSIATSIELFEPRFKVTSVTPTDVDRLGQMSLEIVGEYRPRALLGDNRSSGFRRVILAANDGIRRQVA